MQGNPYGLDSLWLQGDFVIRGVAILLLLLSIASWYVIVTKALQLLRYRRASAVAGRQFWDASNVQEGVAALGSNNPYADLAQAGVKAMHHHSAHQGHLHDQLSVSDWVTLSLRQADFISAVRLQGASPLRVLWKHIIPLCLPSVIIRITMNMAGIILTAAGLGFLGLGAQPPDPEWGAMISSGRSYMMECWWVVTVPGLAILINSLAFNFLGDGLRDILDPRNE